jgi:hypothetical protein
MLKEGEARVPVARILRKHGISQAKYTVWEPRCGGLNSALPS